MFGGGRTRQWNRESDEECRAAARDVGRGGAACAASTRIGCIEIAYPDGSCAPPAGIALACAWDRAGAAPSGSCCRRAGAATPATSANGGSHASGVRWRGQRSGCAGPPAAAPERVGSTPAPESYGLVWPLGDVRKLEDQERTARRGRQRRAVR